MSEENVMDAVNAALGDVITAPEETPDETEEVSVHSEDVSETTDGDVPGDGTSAEGDEPEEGEETEAEAEARGAERGPDGKFKKKEEKPEGEAEKPKVEPPKKDPLNDPIPKDLKKDTQERIRTLIDRNKAETERADKVQQDFDYLVKGVEATGTSPAQYGETLSWLALFNSNDPAQQEKALELVESVAERLATLLGKERNIGDPLSAHTDLKEAVAKGQVTLQYAKEIARTRNGQQFRTELTTSANTAQQQQAQAAQELATARTGLSALEQTLLASDPSYEAKKAILVPALKPVFASIPPSQWVSKFQEAYKAIKVSAPAPAPKPKAPVNQPLRAGKQPAGGQTKAPGSMLEAISGALNNMSGK